MLPDADNTLIFYIVGDNGASSEGGPDGTLDEIKNLAGIMTPIEEILKDLDKLGGPETEPHYPVGWAWAGNTPFQWVKQVASHLGGSRNPMVVSWPAKIKHDDKPRGAFLHLVDIAPTIYEAVHVTMPDTVNGIEQLPLAGKSFLASFTHPSFQGRSESSISRSSAIVRSTRIAGRPMRSTPCRGNRMSRPATGTRIGGSSTSWTRTSPRPTTSRHGCPRNSRR